MYYYWYSALGPVWAQTRVQSSDWYGSGTLHAAQVLKVILPLLSPAFLDVPTFHHQVPPRPPRRERSQRRKWELKNPTASAGFEPANLGTKGQHATPRPQKPLIQCI